MRIPPIGKMNVHPSPCFLLISYNFIEKLEGIHVMKNSFIIPYIIGNRLPNPNCASLSSLNPDIYIHSTSTFQRLQGIVTCFRHEMLKTSQPWPPCLSRCKGPVHEFMHRWDPAGLAPIGADWGWAVREEEMAGGWLASLL
ncbi:hypothetical protein QTO34_013672 [Cnephaeus nilssonii]|uniref:Uncharacterized protein n=1 Tax=Cnephaeus nilssonii TaxID=3371016 RepID=A0AA40LV59_CNENI|nr:hypothetical protein QTO34_013672 [Eptesicus nilssonii]